MATEVEQLYLQLELINIEEQMLIVQMLKHRRQKRRLRRWSLRPLYRSRLGTGEFTTLVVNLQPGWTNALSIISNVNVLLRRKQPLRPEKATAGNYVLSGPITALTACVYVTCS